MAKRKIIKIGVIPFRYRIKLTLLQLYEMGQLLKSVKFEGLKGNNIIAEALSNCDNAMMMQELLLIALFHGKLTRWIFRPYFKKYATVLAFRKLLEAIDENNDTLDFVSSLVLLKVTGMETTAGNADNNE